MHAPPRFHLAIFDLDGTLADSFPWFIQVMNNAAREYGFRAVDQDEIQALRRAGSREILTRLQVPLWKLPLIARRMRALKAEGLHTIELFDGAAEMLQTLAARGITLALVSSDNEANVRRQLGKDSADLFSFFACGASLFGKAKKFRSVLRRSRVAPELAIAIGDEVRDAEAARAAGIAFGAVEWGYAHPEALLKTEPDLVFSAMRDITTSLIGQPV
jgi:phosphoglycolate phosphatase